MVASTILYYRYPRDLRQYTPYEDFTRTKKWMLATGVKEAWWLQPLIIWAYTGNSTNTELKPTGFDSTEPDGLT